MKIIWRSELVSVEKLLDEEWLGAKDQSNPEIARTPRNVCRDSLEVKIYEGKALV